MTIKGEYGESEQGNFKVVDTIGVPHPYCITNRHVAHASDNFMGRLGNEAIESAERSGAKCGVKGCNLSFSEHEQALLVSCEKDMQGEDGKADPELHKYLLKIKDEATANGYAGFAFKDDRN